MEAIFYTEGISNPIGACGGIIPDAFDGILLFDDGENNCLQTPDCFTRAGVYGVRGGPFGQIL